MAETPLKEQVAIVTGASRGIGRGVAQRLAAMGALVICAARNAHELAGVAREIQQSGSRAEAAPTDMRSRPAVVSLIENAIRRHGRVDILVNNAGIGKFGVPLYQMAQADWSAVMETNLDAIYYAIAAVAPHMIGRQTGHIINIASLAGHNPVPGAAAYAASKAGLHGLTVSVAEELRQYGIRVSLICPGSVDTELSPVLVGGKDRSKMLTPDDIAHVVAMLVTQTGASFVSEVLIRPTRKP